MRGYGYARCTGGPRPSWPSPPPRRRRLDPASRLTGTAGAAAHHPVGDLLQRQRLDTDAAALLPLDGPLPGIVRVARDHTFRIPASKPPAVTGSPPHRPADQACRSPGTVLTFGASPELELP